jgi:hypothetical protein
MAAPGLLEAVDQHRLGGLQVQEAVRHAALVEVVEDAHEVVEVAAAAHVGRHRRALHLGALMAEQVRQRSDHLGRQVVDAEVAGVLEGGHRLRLAGPGEAGDHDEVLDVSFVRRRHRILLT